MAPHCFFTFFLIFFHFVPVQSVEYRLKGQQVQWVPGITKPPIEILWTHNGNKVVEFDAAKEKAFGSFEGRVTLDNQTAKLQISDLRLEDSGKYEAEIYLEGKWIMKSFELGVIKKVAKPTITCQMSSSIMSAVLVCIEDLSQPPSPLQFQWISKGKVQLGSLLRISLGGELDEQQYTCQVSNPLSQQTATFTAKHCNTDAGFSAGLIVTIVISIMLLISVCVCVVLIFLVLKYKSSKKKEVQQMELESRQNLNETNRPLLKNQLTAEYVTEPQSQVEADHSVVRSSNSLQSASAVLGKIPDSMNLEFLKMLVENILVSGSRSATRTFALELLPDISSAVVTFQSKKECTCFLKKCPKNTMFQTKQMSVHMLEVAQQVLIEDVQELSEDSLRLCVEQAGVKVKSIRFSEDKQSAILTLKDHKAVQKILKQKHHIMEEEFTFFPYYESLGTALYGNEKPSPKLPKAVTEHIENGVWSYLQENQPAADTIHSHMEKHFCKVNLEEQNVSLSPDVSLLQQKDAKVLVKQWRDVVTSEFAQCLSDFKSVKLKLEAEVWDDSEKAIRGKLQKERVVVVPDKVSGHLVVAGHAVDIDRLEQSLFKTVKEISKMKEREKLCVTKEVKVSQAVYHIKCLNGFQEKHSHLKMTYKSENSNLIVTGLAKEIVGLEKAVGGEEKKCKRQTFRADRYIQLFKK